MPKETKKSDDFVHLHVHSDASQLDGASSVKSYMEACAERGSSAIAFTEHGSMRSFYEAHIQGEKTNVKPIYGIEFYVANDMTRKGLTSEEKDVIGAKAKNQTEKKELVKAYELEKGIRDRWHITALAENDQGLKNLFKLSTLAFDKGFYYKPRIDLKTLCEYNEGILITTGCLSSPFHNLANKGKRRKAISEAERLYEVFGDRFFIELQPHNIQEQRVANKFGLTLQKRFGDIKTIAAQDAHYVNSDDALTHEVMLCIGTHDKMSNPDRFRFDGTEYFLKTRRQMQRTFEKHHKYMTDVQTKQSLDNTILIAERCSAKVEVDYHKAILPNVPLPSGYESDFEYIKSLCLDGFKKRLTTEHIARVASKKGMSFDDMFKVYKDRLKRELTVLNKQKFIKYFLVVEDLYKWVREQKIMYGFGRGSASGSIVTFLLGITVVDPIEHNLLFERFISEDRIDLPDCLPKEVLIETPKGGKPIKDIRPGDVVLSSDGWKTVKASHIHRHTGEILKIKTLSKTLLCTPNHPLSVDNVWIKAKGVKVGDEVLCDLRKSVSANKKNEFLLFENVCQKKTKKKERADIFHKNLSFLRYNVSSESRESKILFEQMYRNRGQKKIPGKGLRVLRKGVCAEKREAEKLFSKVWSKKWRNKRQEFQWEQRVETGTRSLCDVEHRRNVRQIFKRNRSGLRIRTDNNQVVERSGLQTGFFHSNFKCLCRDKRLEKTKYKEDRDHTKNFCKNGFKVVCGLSQRSCETFEKEKNDSFVRTNTGIENEKKSLQVLREDFYPFEEKESSILRFELCQSDDKSPFKAAIFQRKDKKAMFTMWRDDDFTTLRESPEILQPSLSKPFVCWKKEKIISIEKESFDDFVFTLSVPGPNNFVANGILVKNCDMDFEKSGRQKILDHLREQYGEGRVCQITTVSKLTGRQCIKDVSRVFGVPFNEANEITNNILDDKSDESTIGSALRESKVCQEFNKKYPEVFEHAIRLEGLSKHLGVHAGGVIITPDDLTNYIPVEVRKHHGKDILISSVDKNALEALSLVKLDILGLKTLTILREALGFVKEYENVDIDVYSNLTFSDKKTLQGFNEGDFAGIFQFDTPGAEKICEGVKFKDFEDIVTMTSLNRPGATRSGLAAQYLDKKIRKKKFESLHEKIDEIAKDSLGVLIYQEHITRIFAELGGYSLSDADKVRKKISKSKGSEEVEKERTEFVEGAQRNGISEETANKIMDTMIAFGGYAFTRAHSVAYSMLSYWCMYLKQHYPLHFYCALLRSEETKEKVQLIAKSAKKRGIDVLPPHVSVSGKNFSVDYKLKAIRASLLDLKGVGEVAAETIFQNAPYRSFEDFVERIDRRKANKGVILSLLKADTLGGLVPNQKWLIEHFEDVWPLFNDKGKKKKALKLIKRSGKLPDYTENERKMIAMKFNPSMNNVNVFDLYEDFMKENVVVPIGRIADEGFFDIHDEQGVYIAGMVLDTKIQKVGDFHTGEELTEAEKEQKNFGARFAKVNIEDISGENIRIKFDYDVFDDMQKVLEAPFGTPIVAHCYVNARWKSLKVNFAVDIDAFREKIMKKEELSIWENIISGRHPALYFNYKDEKDKKLWVTNERFKKTSSRNLFCGVVTNVQEKLDKNGNRMAFFGMLGADNYFTKVVCFKDSWAPLRKEFLPGRLFKLELEKGKRSKFGKNEIFTGGLVKWLKV